MKLTQQAIAKIISAPFEIKLINGSFNCARLRVAHGRGGYSLEVECSHPLLEWASGVKQDVRLVEYDTRGMSSGLVTYLSSGLVEIPLALATKIQQMKTAATMNDETAKKRDKEMRAAFKHTMYELGIRGSSAAHI